MSDRFPPQIKYIVGNEACERFSYYGMRAILVIFMTDYLKMTQPHSEGTYHLFASAVYLLPLLGAFISDRFLGKYKTIMLLSTVYCLGHLVLSLFESQMGLFCGLALIAFGAGGIKPCVSAHVGDQFTAKNQHLLERVFSIFYFSINFGAFFSSLLIPILLVKYGPSVAFGLPGILMGLATLVFWMGKKHYVHVPPSGKTGPAGFVPVFIAALQGLGSAKQPGEDFFSPALKKYSTEEVEGTRAAWSIFKLFIGVSVFWSLFDQQGSSWTIQAKAMRLECFGYKLEPSQIQALNPIMVMVLIPFFSMGVYPLMQKLGFHPTPLRKMTIGMFLAASSFAIVGVFQHFLDAGVQLSVAWQIIPYLVITMAEVMVSITGLEFAYTQAPRAMKSTIMSFWLLTVFFGNMLAAYVALLNKMHGAGKFYFYAVLMLIVSGVFAWVASRYKTRSYLEKA